MIEGFKKISIKTDCKNVFSGIFQDLFGNQELFFIDLCCKQERLQKNPVYGIT